MKYDTTVSELSDPRFSAKLYYLSPLILLSCLCAMGG
jgi:hypothetical protein